MDVLHTAGGNGNEVLAGSAGSAGSAGRGVQFLRKDSLSGFAGNSASPIFCEVGVGDTGG